MSTTPQAVAMDAYQQAHDAYLADHPEPRKIDFACPRCKAEPGEPCTWGIRRGREFHLARQDRWARAFNRRIFDANWAGDAAYTKALKEMLDEMRVQS